MKSPYSTLEQETTINVVPASVSGTAEIYTCIPNMIQRILKLYEEHPDEVAIVDGDGYINATVPREWIKIQPKRKCNMSEEKRREAAERLIALRKAKAVAKDDAT